ncbi:hypothetical protein [Micromonospora palomenae]|uniref:hypothetical protein n=1 Tax=Micromonospora palomenae TaxID=1461247 RepID=UPI003F8A69D3
MLRAVNSIGDRLLRLVVPQVTASAICGCPHYQYRCNSTGYYQRRYCCGCTMQVTCDPWQTLYFGC